MPTTRTPTTGAGRPSGTDDSVEVARIGLNCGVGVAGGSGLCMPLGGRERRRYWSVGRFMHLAGRLMEAARSGVLCTEAIAERARRVVSISPERPLFSLKGIRTSRSTVLSRFRRACPNRTAPNSCTAAKTRWRSSSKVFAAFEEGRGAVLSVVGDAGIGKTTLVQYLRQAAAKRADPVPVRRRGFG